MGINVAGNHVMDYKTVSQMKATMNYLSKGITIGVKMLKDYEWKNTCSFENVIKLKSRMCEKVVSSILKIDLMLQTDNTIENMLQQLSLLDDNVSELFYAAF